MPPFSCLLAACLLGICPTAGAQETVAGIKGDIGLIAGTQPPPGIYLISTFNYYRADETRTYDGASLDGKAFSLYTFAFTAAGILDWTIAGAAYGLAIALPFADAAIEMPETGGVGADWGRSDIYARPVWLGWHWSLADATAFYGLTIPVGKYEQDEAVNTDGARVGNTLTLEGGAGGSLLKRMLNVGVAYYAQFKVTEDRGFSLPQEIDGRHRYLGAGPELGLNLPVGKQALVLMTGRYFAEFWNLSATQGTSFILNVSLGMPEGGL